VACGLGEAAALRGIGCFCDKRHFRFAKRSPLADSGPSICNIPEPITEDGSHRDFISASVG
jgi:hypothetical protein